MVADTYQGYNYACLYMIHQHIQTNHYVQLWISYKLSFSFNFFSVPDNNSLTIYVFVLWNTMFSENTSVKRYLHQLVSFVYHSMIDVLGAKRKISALEHSSYQFKWSTVRFPFELMPVIVFLQKSVHGRNERHRQNFLQSWRLAEENGLLWACRPLKWKSKRTILSCCDIVAYVCWRHVYFYVHGDRWSYNVYTWQANGTGRAF